jgi:hypothetical protein
MQKFVDERSVVGSKVQVGYYQVTQYIDRFVGVPYCVEELS